MLHGNDAWGPLIGENTIRDLNNNFVQLSERVWAIDWRDRMASLIGKVTQETCFQVVRSALQPGDSNQHCISYGANIKNKFYMMPPAIFQLHKRIVKDLNTTHSFSHPIVQLSTSLL